MAVAFSLRGSGSAAAQATGLCESAMRMLDVAQSPFVAGFLLRCKEAGVIADQPVFSAIQQAMAAHPAVAEEFGKCGMVKVAVGGPSFKTMGYKLPEYRPGKGVAPVPAKVDTSWYDTLDIAAASPTPKNFAASRAMMRLPMRPSKPILGTGTPLLDTLSGRPVPYSTPQQVATPTGTPIRRPGLQPSPPPTAPDISTVPREQWTPEMVQQWQKKLTAGDYSENPYFRSHDLAGEWTRDMPARIGGLRTDAQGFQEDLSRYLSGFTPDAKKRFATLVEETGMEPGAILRAMQSEKELTNRMPMLASPSRNAAQQLYDRGEFQKAPAAPDYNTIMRNFYELPPKWRENMLQWQQREQKNWPQQADKAAEPPGTWIFPPRSEFAHEGWDQENMPRMLEHTKYRGLPQYMQTFTEPKSRDLGEYWKQQMEQANDPARQWRGQFGGQGDPKAAQQDWLERGHVSPQNYARAYKADRNRRMGQRTFWEDELRDPNSLLIQRFHQWRRNNPATGKEIFTTKGIGRNPDGLSGAIRDTIAGGAFMAPATLLSAVLGDKAVATMTSRDVMSLYNYLMDSDVGASVNIGAAPPGFGKDGPGYNTAIGRNVGVTRGMFGPKIDPTTGTYKDSGMGTLSRFYGANADSPDAGKLSRFLNRGGQAFTENAGDLLAAATAMRAMKMNPRGAGQFAKRLGLTGVTMEAAPTLLDPMREQYNPGSGSILPRGKETIGKGLKGLMLPYAGLSPAFAAGEQALRDNSLTGKYYKGPDWLRLATMADDNKSNMLSSVGEGAATAMEALPGLIATRRLTGPGLLAQKYPGLRNVDKLLSPEYAGLIGAAGAKNAPEGPAYREQIQSRYDMPRNEYLRWQEGQSRVGRLFNDWGRGIEADPAVLAKTLSVATPEQAAAIRELVGLTSAQRVQGLKGQAVSVAAPEATPQPQAPQQFDPSAVDTPEGMSDAQAAAGWGNAVSAAWETMPSQQQQAWIQRGQVLEDGLFQAYSRMPELQGQDPARIRQAAASDAVEQWQSEFSSAYQIQLQVQPETGGQ